VKEALDEKARASGHTQSQEAVRLIELGLQAEGTRLIYVLPIADAAQAIERLGVPLHSDAGQRLFVRTVKAILQRLPLVPPTDQQYAYAVARFSDSPDPNEIAKAKAAVDAYEAELERKADLIWELMKFSHERS